EAAPAYDKAVGGECEDADALVGALCAVFGAGVGEAPLGGHMRVIGVCEGAGDGEADVAVTCGEVREEGEQGGASVEQRRWRLLIGRVGREEVGGHLRFAPFDGRAKRAQGLYWIAHAPSPGLSMICVNATYVPV